MAGLQIEARLKFSWASSRSFSILVNPDQPKPIATLLWILVPRSKKRSDQRRSRDLCRHRHQSWRTSTCTKCLMSLHGRSCRDLLALQLSFVLLMIVRHDGAERRP